VKWVGRAPLAPPLATPLIIARTSDSITGATPSEFSLDLVIFRLT